ncbi:hypothetical protein FB451DRAFT_1213781 [Mycena latifolia]|nr:hypothetical protein FB451DRAFT_1213781 [Mycena latifolia]
MYPYQYPHQYPQQYPQQPGVSAAQYAHLALRQSQIQDQLNMQLTQQRFAAQRGSSSGPRPPPSIPNSSVGRSVGVPIHVCANAEGECTKCRTRLNDAANNYTVSGFPDRARLPHLSLDVVVATRYRSAKLRIPSTLQGKLAGFDWTVQLADLPRDDTAWIYGRDRVLAIVGQMTGDTVVIRKPTGDMMSMTRVSVGGQGYVVDWVLQGAPEHPDIGLWGWYRYLDGSVRVWNWHGTQNTPPTLIAWKDPGEWHWHFYEGVVRLLAGDAEVAGIVTMVGIIIYCDMGRSLTMP